MRDELVRWFVENYPQDYKDMMESNHYVDMFTINPYHGEGSIWTHTMMVMTWIEAKKESFKYDDYLVLVTAGLLHDIGKPQAEEFKEASETKPVRNSFHGHEGISVQKAVHVLKNMRKDFSFVTDQFIKDVLFIVGTHGVHIEGEDKIELRNAFREADKGGAIRRDTDIQEQYPCRKFAKRNLGNTSNKELIIMVGLPASGKTTYIDNNLSDYTVFSRDDLIEQFFNINTDNTGNTGTYSEAYKWVHETEDRLDDFNKYFEGVLTNMVKSEDKVVIDMTMMSLKSRRNMLNRFNKFKATAVVLFTDHESLNKRNEQRSKNGKSIPDFVLLNMSKSFVFPVKDEGFEKIITVVN